MNESKRLFGDMVERAADIIMQHGRPAISRKALVAGLQDIDLCARCEEAVTIGEKLAEAGFHDASVLVLRRMHDWLKQIEQRKIPLRPK